MPIDQLDSHTALVVIDLQRGITALPTFTPAEDVVAHAAALADAFRARSLPVVLVRTAFSAGGADMLTPRTDAAPPAITPSADFAELRPELGEADVVITKRQWDAFFGTELDLQLRRRGVTTIVLVGIATSIGVESTARQAFSLGYELVFATDALSDLVADAHDNSVATIFPRLGRLDSSANVVAAVA